jgi:hypothetical protein
MNIFEDLIEELKEENLLEETVNLSKSDAKKADSINNIPISTKITGDFEDTDYNAQKLVGNTTRHDETLNIPASPNENSEEVSPENNLDSQTEDDQKIYEQTENQPPISEKEFYRKRAMEEVSALQMVEHVLSGVEREQMKVVPKPYDDLPVKKSLHSFMQVSEDVKSVEHAQSEFLLMQETESWCSALSHRDRRVSVAHLRRYCETTRPPLSSQALISLARFYRNLPFSESVRSKFDLVITRLFSKDIGGDKRIIVFTRDELIGHLKELYAEWSSIQLYSEKDDDSEVVLAAMKFEEFMTEAERSDNFDELVNNDFFNRLRLFKENTNELFYAPLVAATAIECNIRIGNKYVDLIDDQREKANTDQFQDKYGFLHDQAISDATSKTLQLVELLKERVEEVEPEDEQINENIQQNPIGEYVKREAEIKKAAKLKKKVGKGTFAVNKFLLAATIVVTLLSAVLYFGVNSYTDSQAVSSNVKKVNLDNSSLSEFIESARISTESFYGITTPAWENLTNEKKEENLTKIYALGTEQGFTKVFLINKEGKTVGTASAEGVTAITP